MDAISPQLHMGSTTRTSSRRLWSLPDGYVSDVVELCHRIGAAFIIPGGEQPNALLAEARPQLTQEGIQVMSNTADVVELFSDKDATFNKLATCGIPIPRTTELTAIANLDDIGLPCIVKPSTGSGGSVSVFFAVTAEEALGYAELIRRTGRPRRSLKNTSTTPKAEFTIGVLSLQNGDIVGSIALKRLLGPKLSVAYRGRGGVISSGYSQGYIDEFPISVSRPNASRPSSTVGAP